MTNYERWQLIMRDVTSPQSFIDFSFYFLISAALQRRVWMGGNNPNEPGQLYTNNYTILVGPAACGKGRAILPALKLLQHHKIDIATGKIIVTATTLDDTFNPNAEEFYLFPCGPKSITFEQLVRKMALSYRRFNVQIPGLKGGVYGHSSMYLALEELSSLMQHDTRKICDYMLDTYDCNDYRRETKTQGFDQIRKPCLSLLAGTTPAFLEESFNDKLLADGLTSRIWFIYEMAPRHLNWKIRQVDSAQTQATVELLEHLAKLSTLFGRCEFTPEADDWCETWWKQNLIENPIPAGLNIPPKRANNSLKLDSYYGRKDIHLKKMAMIQHFAEQTESYTIPLSTAQYALSVLDEVEKRMHLAITFGGRNPLHGVGKNIMHYMHTCKKPLSKVELLQEFHSDLREMELQEVLRVLVETEQVVYEIGKYMPTILGNRWKKNIIKFPTASEEKTIGADLPALPLDKKTNL